MRNDHKGRVEHDATLGIQTFYASGERGAEVRADGKGGFLERGYYVTGGVIGLLGPFSCRKRALRAHFLARSNLRSGMAAAVARDFAEREARVL